MLKKSLLCGLVLGALLSESVQARAQNPLPGGAPAPISRPTVSPYLNLLNRSNSAAFNYYGTVRPQIEFRSSINQLDRQLATTQDSLREGAGLVTGHTTYFFNYAPYFAGRGLPGSGSARNPVPASPLPRSR